MSSITVTLGAHAKTYWDYLPQIAQAIIAVAALSGPYWGWRIARYQMHSTILLGYVSTKFDGIEEDLANLLALQIEIRRCTGLLRNSAEPLSDEEAKEIRSQLRESRTKYTEVMARLHLRIEGGTSTGDALLAVIHQITGGAIGEVDDARGLVMRAQAHRNRVWEDSKRDMDSGHVRRFLS